MVTHAFGLIDLFNLFSIFFLIKLKNSLVDILTIIRKCHPIFTNIYCTRTYKIKFNGLMFATFIYPSGLWCSIDHESFRYASRLIIGSLSRAFCPHLLLVANISVITVTVTRLIKRTRHGT